MSDPFPSRGKFTAKVGSRTESLYAVARCSGSYTVSARPDSRSSVDFVACRGYFHDLSEITLQVYRIVHAHVCRDISAIFVDALRSVMWGARWQPWGLTSISALPDVTRIPWTGVRGDLSCSCVSSLPVPGRLVPARPVCHGG